MDSELSINLHSGSYLMHSRSICPHGPGCGYEDAMHETKTRTETETQKRTERECAH